jgi:photoactive yellow protein
MPPSALPAPASSVSSPEFLLGLERCSAAELDQLPCGTIELDRQGLIRRYNQYEADLARRHKDSTVGKNFFTEVAPCTRVQEFYGRFLQGLERRQLYETFDFQFNFVHGPRPVLITLWYSEKTDSVWVLVNDQGKAARPGGA